MAPSKNQQEAQARPPLPVHNFDEKIWCADCIFLIVVPSHDYRGHAELIMSLGQSSRPSLRNPEQTYDQVILDTVHYVYNYEITSERAWRRARLALLDALGCAVAAAASNKECATLIGPVVQGTKVPQGARVLGSSFELDPVKAAFDNGLLIRYLDYNDGFPGAEWGHPSDNLGAIISVMDWLSRSQAASGSDAASRTLIRFVQKADKSLPCPLPPNLRTLLTALIKAYEIQGCFQIKNSFNKVGLDHTILVKVASTAVVSWILGLKYDQALAAVSQAWQDGHPLRTFRQAPNTGPRKGWAAGDACMRAVHLCLVTAAGQPGAPSVLTAPQWGFYATLFKNNEFVLPRRFSTWVIENIFFKTIAAEGHGITAVYAALQLCKTFNKLGIQPENDIARIDVRTHAAAKIIIDKSGPLNNAADRDHCMQYLISVTLLKGSVIEAEDYADDSSWSKDQRVDKLRSKIFLIEDESFTRDYHDHTKRYLPNALKVVLNDGTELKEVTVLYGTGHPLSTKVGAAVRTKFFRNMRGTFSIKRAVDAWNAVRDDEMQVHSFVDLFTTGKLANL